MVADLQRLEDILIHGWGIERPLSTETLKPGVVWRVTPGAGTVCILKNWGVRDSGLEERVDFYQEVMRHVSARGVPVEIARHTLASQLLYRDCGEAWWLTGDLANAPTALSTQEDLDAIQRDYGRSIAKLHGALASYPEADARRRTWSKDIASEVSKKFLPNIRNRLSASRREAFEAVVSPHEHDLVSHLSGLPTHLIFYDCHHGNILRVAARVTGFVDADHLSFGPRIWDLFYLISQGIHDITRDQAALWPRHAYLTLDAYAEVIPLEPRERTAIWYGMLACKLNMLSEVLNGSTLDEEDTVLDHLLRLSWVRPYFAT